MDCEIKFVVIYSKALIVQLIEDDEIARHR